MITFFDTETTGFPLKDRPLDGVAQPHLVQLAAITIDNDQKPVAEVNILIRPDGWNIPKEASDVHGITQERALRYGVREQAAFGLFSRLVEMSETLVAHNINFDKKIMDICATRYGRQLLPNHLAYHCTMISSTNLCKIPNPVRGGYKWPKLQEVYTFLFGKPFEGAHDAMADIRACMQVYFELKNRGISL